MALPVLQRAIIGWIPFAQGTHAYRSQSRSGSRRSWLVLSCVAMHFTLHLCLPVCSIAAFVFACSQSGGIGSTSGQGGASVPSSSSSASGGSTTSFSSSSTAAIGGAQGGSATQSGGAASGGISATLATSGTGGTKATGGTNSTTKGGTSSMGGTSASTANTTFATTNATGGSSTGGTKASGGASATGGTRASGGITAVGGAVTGGTTSGGASTGAATGGAATGGAATGGASSCTWSGAPQSSDGQLTCYWFSQGTPNNFPDCPSMYKTYCGYCGTETGKRNTTSPYPCAIGEIQNTVQHMSTPHFAAFPQGSFEQGKYCGMCVDVTYMGKTITATVVDACGSCSETGHLDLSLSAAEALGMTEWNGSPNSGVSWKAVGCPVTDDIYVRYNGSDTQQPYFQNVAFPIASAKVDTQSATLNTGFWMFQGNVGGKTVTLTDTMGHTIQGKMPTSAGSLGVQFPLTCQ